MPEKPATPKKEASVKPATDPVAKARGYKSIAAQYTKAKTLKENEDAVAKKKAGGTEKLNGEAPGDNAKGPMTDAVRLNKRKEGLFKKSWNSIVGFFVFVL
jgi:hypothetical protein